MVKRLFTSKKSERGQSFMELAVSIVFLLVLLSAVIDLGWAFYTLIALRDAAQEAASFGAICPPTDTANLDRVVDRLRKSANAPLNLQDIPAGNIAVEVLSAGGGVSAAPAPATLGDTVRVSITVNHRIITPFLGMFVGNNWTYPLSVNVSDTVLRKTCIP